jgi:hypothetical protein
VVFRLRLSSEAKAVLAELETDASFEQKLRKVRRCLGQVQVNPRHPGLAAHKFRSLTGPSGQEVWEVYVENRTPSAWRVWFWYGPDRDTITILTIGPHP